MKVGEMSVCDREEDAGFALIEVLISLFVLILIVWAFSKALGVYSAAVAEIRVHSEAVTQVRNDH